MPAPIDLHLVGGFLGSGKTTAIVQAAQALVARGRRVGIVTNDQGKSLVDTAFFHQAGLPTVEVTGGCFCCHYDDLEARIGALREEAQPEVIFAESVGSCGDLVATVLKPLLALRGGEVTPSSFSVFTDSRLLKRYLAGDELPFSENVTYLFGQQIEEAGLIVINKADLLGEGEASTLQAAAQRRFPGKPVRLQNSTRLEEIRGWLAAIESARGPLPEALGDMDYRRYGDGEAQLAWLDASLAFQAPEGQGQSLARELIAAMGEAISRRGAAIGHLKYFIQTADRGVKVSLTTLASTGWQESIPPIPGDRFTLMVNARVEIPAETLRGLLLGEIDQVCAARGAAYRELAAAAFHPGFPNPTHRMG